MQPYKETDAFGQQYYDADTYTAVFELGTVNISFVTDGNGSINEGTTTIPMNAGSTYKVDTDGKLTFYEPEDTERQTPITAYTKTLSPFIGYKVATPAWKFVDATGDVDIDNKPLMTAHTFKAVFSYQTDVKLSYFVAGSNSLGYLDSGTQHLQTFEQNLANPINPPDPPTPGCITPITAVANEGYRFAY